MILNSFFKKYKEYAEKTPDKILLRIDENTLTYKDFMDKTAIIASGLLKLGIGENDKVGIFMPNSIEWYLIFWSAVRIGAQPVPIDPQSGSFELIGLIPNTEIKICFIAEKYRNNSILKITDSLIPETIKLEKVIVFNDNAKIPEKSEFISFAQFKQNFCCRYNNIYEFDDKHIMSLACTSGSTGKPKILSVPYNGFYQALDDMGDYLGFTSDEVMMLGMTLYHQGGFGMGLQATLKGGTVMYQPQFNPVSFLETVQNLKVTVIQLTSTLAKILLSTPDFDKYDLSSVKICYFAGEVLPQNIADIFTEKLHIRVINIIGSSETATMVIWDSDRDSGSDPSDFSKLPFTDFRVIDNNKNDVPDGEVGELCIYTTAVIADYFGNPELSAQTILADKEGKRWFCTGDLVQKLENRKIRFAGRSKRIIKRGGNLVHAEEVEATLLSHPLISAVAVTAEKHPVIGQQIIAYIQTVNGLKITRGEIAKFFDGKLSAYKIPDKIYLTEEIPKDIGKIQFKYLK